MVNKSKGKAAKGGKTKPPLKKPQQTSRQEQQAQQQTPQERVTLVRPLWETLPQDERVELLTIDLEHVRARAKQLAEAARKQAVADAPEGEPLDPALLELEPSIEDVLEGGIKRLKEKGTWKLWQWPADNGSMYDAESFRQHITEKHIREELRRFLPRDEAKATEKPAEAAFRQRMLDLLAKVQQSSSASSVRPTVVASAEDSASRPHRRRGDPGSHLRDANIELLALLLEALARENDHLYHSLLMPITAYVMEILPEGHRETTKLELSFEDLENLLPDDVSRIVEWLTEKVDALTTKLKPEPKDGEEEEEENMGDVDLWALTEEDKGITVNGRWLQHLQDRMLGDDGHPRRTKPGEDPNRNGLILEWIYGSIVSTAEKARDGAKRGLGMQPATAVDAHTTLVRALEEHLSWESRAKQCKDLLSEMLKSRLEAAELTKQGWDLRPQPTPLPGRLPGSDLPGSLTSPLLLEDGSAAGGGESKPLPDEVILFMLRREALLTRAKLHWLVFEHLTQEKELRILKQQLRQGEPEFERLKRELDEVKHQPRMEGAYRNAAEMERHRHQVEVQTAFREQGARLQATYDKKQKAEYDMAKRETEIKQLQGWKGTVENLVEKFQELIASRNERMAAAAANGAGEGARDGGSLETDGDLEAAAGSLTPQQYVQLTKMRNHYNKDVRKQLYGDADDRLFFDNLKAALKAIERRLEDSSVALQHLEMQLINVACDDPGAVIGTQLALPLLQERLDDRGLEYAAQRAKLAEDEVLKMELLAIEREQAERDRKKAAKAKKNEKAKSEKERLAAERQAKEEAYRQAKEEAERERVVREEEERRKRVEAMEAKRKAEEAAMELRRKELLSDENGYWRQRMIMEERLSGMGMAVGAAAAAPGPAAAAAAPEPSEAPERASSSSPADVRRGGDDEEGFVTESRRRRHKDTARDQDEEPAAPASASAPSGPRGHARSGSRDRTGPRERGEQSQQQHREREREPRKHHGSSAAGGTQRSGSREVGGGRHGSQAGAAHPPPRPPSSSPTPAEAAAPQPRAQPNASSSASSAAPAPATAATAESSSGSERPSAAPAAVAPAAKASTAKSPVPAAQPPAAAAAAPSAAAPAPPASPKAASAVPEDAILFGDIPVIPTATGTTAPPKPAVPIPVPVPVPTPVPVPVPVPAGADSAPQKSEPVPAESRQGAPSASQPQPSQQTQPPQQPQPATASSLPMVSGPAPVTKAVAPQAQAQPQSQQPQPQQMPVGPVPGQPSQQPPQMPAPAGPPGHPMGPVPPGAMHGHMPTMVPGPGQMQVIGAPPPAGHAAGPRPQGPGAPPPPYMHINGAMPMHGGPMPPMGAMVPKQMPGQQMQGMPPPPPGTVLVPMHGHPGARPAMPGPGMPPGVPPPGMQLAQQQQQGGPMVRPPGPGPMGQPGPMPGMPAPGHQGGLVHVPHPPSQPQQQGMPPGAAPRGGPGPQGQPMILAPMQFPGAGPMHGPGVALPHGHGAAPPGGPMGHAPPPPGVYAFPPGMMPPGPGQMPQHPHPHMLPVIPVAMAGPPLQQVQAPPQQQPQQAALQGGQGVAQAAQPPPPPKSPSASVSSGGSKPSSTLNANARSFVPSGKAAAAVGASASSAQPQAAQGQPQQGQRQGYQRQGGVSAEGGTGAAPLAPGQQPQAAYVRGGSGQQSSGPYGSGRRDRGPRGGAGPRDGAAGGPGRKGQGAGAPGPHGLVPQQQMQPGDMPGGQVMAPHAHGAAPHPMGMMGAPPMMVMMGPGGPIPVHPPPMPHGPGMEQGDASATGLTQVGPLERRPSAAAVEEASRHGAAGAEPGSGQQGPPAPPPPPPPGMGPGHHPMMPAPPQGMPAPGQRMMLVMQPGMPGPVPVPMMPVQVMHVPMHMPMPVHPPVGAPGPSDGHVQKNGSAAELTRAPRAAQGPDAAAAASAAADGEGQRGGDDSAAAASATAPETASKEGGAGAAASGRQEGEPAASQRSDADQAPKPSVTAGGAAVSGRPMEQEASPSAPQGDSAAGETPPQQGPSGAAGPSGRSPSGSTSTSAPSPPSWSAVAARRETQAAAASTSGSLSAYQSDAFPSLVPSGNAGASASAAAGDTAASAHCSTWKAKLQQNAASTSTTAAAGGRSPPAPTGNGTPGGPRGSSPRATLNGGVHLAASLSDSAMAHGNGGGAAQPPRPPGNRPSGSTLLTGPPSQLVGSLALPAAAAPEGAAAAPPPAIVYHPGVGGKARRLQLVRGLQNLGGQHNCFLNVSLQSLWHLRTFRDAVLAMDVEEVGRRGAAAADVAVLRSLANIFRAMAAPPAAAASWAVSPAPLREALSMLETGQSAVRLDLAEMHDAFEVLLVLLTCMHRAEAGSGASQGQGQDPQLPRRVRVRGSGVGAAAAAAVPPTAALANGHAPPAGYAAAVAGAQQKAAAATGKGVGVASGVPSTAAHSLFGLEVQVPVTADEDDGNKGRAQRDSCNGVPAAGAAPESSPSATPPARHGGASGGGRAGDDAAEVEVYTKYFHLVHAQALRKAFAALGGTDGGAYFEDVLCAAESAGAHAGSGRRSGAAAAGQGLANGHGPAHGWAPGATAAGNPLATLLRFPSVFTLALVWESPQAPLDALRGTLEALGPRLDLALLFRCSGGAAAPHSAPCELRSVICYFGHHYLVFALSEELGLWLLIDDATIQLVGHWGDVVKAMVAKRLQPSLLFYEAERPAAGQQRA